MANNKSAEKRIQISERNRLRNRLYKSSVKTLIKTFLKNLEVYKTSKDPGDKLQATKNLSSVYSLIDKGTKKNVFHKNTAARKKSKLAAYLKAAEIR
jgi:small subunit ribosomal protein S20